MSGETVVITDGVGGKSLSKLNFQIYPYLYTHRHYSQTLIFNFSLGADGCCSESWSLLSYCLWLSFTLHPVNDWPLARDLYTARLGWCLHRISSLNRVMECLLILSRLLFTIKTKVLMEDLHLNTRTLINTTITTITMTAATIIITKTCLQTNKAALVSITTTTNSTQINKLMHLPTTMRLPLILRQQWRSINGFIVCIRLYTYIPAYIRIFQNQPFLLLFVSTINIH